MQAKKVLIASESYILRQGLLQVIGSVQSGILPMEVGTFEQLVNQLKTMLKGMIIIDLDIFQEGDEMVFNEEIQDLPGIHVLLVKRQKQQEKSDHLHFHVVHLDAKKEELENYIREKLQSDNGDESGKSNLSDRELDIVKKVALGFTNKEISEALHISPHTVITHRKNITAKLGIKTISGLTVYAMLNNMLLPEDLKHANKS